MSSFIFCFPQSQWDPSPVALFPASFLSTPVCISVQWSASDEPSGESYLVQRGNILLMNCTLQHFKDVASKLQEKDNSLKRASVLGLMGNIPGWKSETMGSSSTTDTSVNGKGDTPLHMIRSEGEWRTARMCYHAIASLYQGTLCS